MNGQRWARVGFALGVAGSLSANIAHSFVRGSSPPAGAVVASAYWPIALLVTLEVIARVDWPEGQWWRFIRFGGLTTVALISLLISYRHMAALLNSYGEDSLSAALGPLAVDGLMAVSSAALLVPARHPTRPKIGEL